jgi:hypothetical protein
VEFEVTAPLLSTEELLDQVNRHARLLGQSTLRRSTLLRWVQEDLIPAPEPVSDGYAGGVRRLWGQSAVRRAERVVELHGPGKFRLYPVYRAVLWLEGEDIPLPRIREDLVTVHAHLAAVVRRKLRSLYWGGDQFVDGRAPRRLRAEAAVPFDPGQVAALPTLLRRSGAPEALVSALVDEPGRSVLQRLVEAIAALWLEAIPGPMNETDRRVSALTRNLPELLEPFRETLTDLRNMAGLDADGSTVLADAIAAAPDSVLCAARDFVDTGREVIGSMCSLVAELVVTELDWLPMNTTERTQLASALRQAGSWVPPLDPTARMLAITRVLAWRRDEGWHFQTASFVLAELAAMLRRQVGEAAEGFTQSVISSE